MLQYACSSINEFSMIRDAIKIDMFKLSEKLDQTIFVALNEAVNNAIFHGKCNKVVVSISKVDNGISISVKHDGEGFTEDGFTDKEYELSEHGRGLEIIKYCTDECYFRENGNELIMYKKM